MVLLLLSIFLGLVTSLIRVWLGGRRLTPPNLFYIWLLFIAFIPQGLAFYWPLTRASLSDDAVAVCLVTSQLLLLVFAWLNRRLPGFWALLLGLALNLLVILLNGGLMPISPEMAAQLIPSSADAIQVGERFGTSKDIILPVDQTLFWWLSDRFYLAFDYPFPYRVAYSLGDVFLALGAFWLLWASSNSLKLSQENTSVEKEIIARHNNDSETCLSN